MNYYETLYIIHPTLESGRLKDIILSLEESLKKLGGKTLSIDFWGKKRLAYFIDKQKYGTYVQLQFTGEGNCTSSFEMELEHNPNILSYLSTLIEEADVVEQENDLDTQIVGQSREAQRIDSRSENVSEKSNPEKDNSEKKNKTSLTEENVVASVKESVKEFAEKDSEAEQAFGDDRDDSDVKDEAEKADASEKSKDHVEENQEDEADTTIVSEEE